MSAFPIYIGYDPREEAAWNVCRESLLRRSSVPLHIVRLGLDGLRWAGLYRRQEYEIDGQRYDWGDSKPFSTDFSFSRFLVPTLAQWDGWALYCDCDFLFTADIAELLKLRDDRYALMCVKHQHDPVEAEKMGGIVQSAYRRKNWSSLILWNCGHPANRAVVPEIVNSHAGVRLHSFEWCPDILIGSLPHAWNWLSGVDTKLAETPCGIHFTLGGPWIKGCEDVPYGDRWLAERQSRRSFTGPLIDERRRAIEAAA